MLNLNDTMTMLKMFWQQWGNHDPQYYKLYVGMGITADQYKELTGVDYVAQLTTQSPEKDNNT